MASRNRRVAIVATGDELVTGAILNTNGQYIAKQLSDHCIHPGEQITVSDTQDHICQALHYALDHHEAIIMIGGLGPTSDDRSRFALAEVTQCPLTFYPQAWEWIITSFNKLKVPCPDNNRIQAQFPAGATPIANPNGSAAACYLRFNDKDIFMLPGPPNECLPLFDQHILPQLEKLNYPQPFFRQTWLLFGVSESQIASQCDPLVSSNCTIAYRVNYPYLEVKLFAEHKALLASDSAKLNTLLNEFSISNQLLTASQQLQIYLAQSNRKLYMTDHATQGHLQAMLSTPQTINQIKFSDEAPAQPIDDHDCWIKIEGLSHYWHPPTTADHIELVITYTHNNQSQTARYQLPQRGLKTLTYATELICLQLIRYLSALT